MLLVAVCPGCDRPGPAPCAECVAGCLPAASVPLPRGLDACGALLAYEGVARQVVTRLKYRNARVPASWLARGMAEMVAPGSVDLVTWAPTTRQRAQARGFDQAELLARRVARELRLPAAPTLARLPGPPQTGRTLVERRDGPRFVARPVVAARPPLRVLVVDDVVTTGATLAAAAEALRAAGVRRVVGLASAHPT